MSNIFSTTTVRGTDRTFVENWLTIDLLEGCSDDLGNSNSKRWLLYLSGMLTLYPKVLTKCVVIVLCLYIEMTMSSKWKTAPAIKWPTLNQRQMIVVHGHFSTSVSKNKNVYLVTSKTWTEVACTGTKFLEKIQGIDLIYQIFNQGCRCHPQNGEA